jgi:hypothetical protein
MHPSQDSQEGPEGKAHTKQAMRDFQQHQPNEEDPFSKAQGV